MSAPLFDTHCHLSFTSFGGEVEDLITRAQAEGVARFLSIGAGEGMESARSAVALAEARHPVVFASVGVHPHDAAQLDEAARDELTELASNPVVVAIGETGLDHHYDHSPREAQAEAFRFHIALARSARKPIIVHTRSAPEDTLQILIEEGARDVGGIIHCFSEDRDFALRALDLGFVSSFSGIVTFPRGTDGIRDAARALPEDAILVETDAPYLAPVPVRGKRNEPAYVAHTARYVANLRGAAEDESRALTTANACRVLKVPSP